MELRVAYEDLKSVCKMEITIMYLWTKQQMSIVTVKTSRNNCREKIG